MEKVRCSMSKSRFMELLSKINNGSLQEYWHNRIAKTRAEKVEERQIQSLGLLTEDIPKLKKIDWTELRIVDINGKLCLRVYGSGIEIPRELHRR